MKRGLHWPLYDTIYEFIFSDALMQDYWLYIAFALQVYRMCTARGGGQAFLCPEGTRFNQRTLVCDHKFRVKCSDSSNFFHRNLIMHEESMRATKLARNRNKGIYRLIIAN